MSALTRFEADQCTVVFLDHTPSLFPVHSIEKLTRFIYLDVVIDEDDVIKRTTFDAFGSERFRRAVEETGERTGIKKLIMCGLWTETSLLQSVTTARSRRRDVAFVEDCSGGVSERSHQAAIHRMVQSGAIPVSWWSLIAELCPDTASEQYRKIYSIVREHAGVDLAPQVAPKPTPAPSR